MSAPRDQSGKSAVEKSWLLLGILAPVSALSAEPDRLVVRADSVSPASLSAPASLSVLDGPIPTFISPRAPAELLNRAAGVQIQSGSGREHLTAIRSPVLTGGAGAGSFLFLQDGVPLRAPGFANVNGLFHAAFPFADSVTVLRGPGDVAYGSNALHGAIDVRTAAPGEARSSAILSYGSFDRIRAIGTIDAGSWLAGLSVLDDGGYRDESGAVEVKGRFAAEIGPGLLRFNFHQLEQETAGFVLGDDAFRDDDLRRSNPNPEAFRDVRHALLSYELPFAANGWSGSVTPFARWTDMEFLQHFLPGDALEENEHTSFGVQSIAFRDLSDRTALALGLDLDLTDGSLREFQEQPTVFSFVQGLHYDYTVQAAEIAPFAKLTHKATERLTLEAGLRSTFTRYEYDNDAPADTVGRFQRSADREDSFTAVTGKLSASFAVATGQNVYASIARGARPPQTTELYRIQINQDVSDIEPETLDSVELGWRSDLGGRGRLALTAFAMRKENVFFRDADGFNVTDGETTHVGIEAELNVDLTETLNLNASSTWAEHRYAFDRNVGNQSEVITDGDFVDTAPETLAAAQLTWQPTDAWRGELAWSHVGRYAMNAANTVFYEGHDLLDLRLQRSLGDDWALTGIVRNALDTRYARRADFAFGNERFFPGEERAFELVLSAQF
ncbi:MAG: TonB-dependent receptor [Pseudomonadota bacterium]